jgi:hypothetical protein
MLTASSTRDDVLAAYRANADYESDGTGGKAAAFIQACRYLLLYPVRSRGAQSEVQWDPVHVQRQLDTAAAWLSALRGECPDVAPPAIPRQLSFERFTR